MHEHQARALMCEIGRLLYDRGFVVSNDGNLSCRLDDRRLLVTPSGICKGQMTPDRLIVTNAEAVPLTAKGRPSSEFQMHVEIYRRRPDAQAVVHAHPPTATGFAVAGIPLDRAVMTETVLTVGPVPLVPYATPGTREVAEQIGPVVERANAMLLANHGVTTLGRSLWEAYHRMETVEQFARVLLVARQLGHVNALTDGQIAQIAETARTP